MGAGPSGLVAALTLLQNGVSVRIIEKESKQRIGQRGSTIQVSDFHLHFIRKALTLNLKLKPRSVELCKYLGILEDMQGHGANAPLMRKYKAGDPKPFKTLEIDPWLEPLPDRPYVGGKLC